MAHEDRVLQHYIKKYRLEHWFQSADSWAKECVSREAAARAEHGEQVQKVVTELEGENEDLKHTGAVTAPETENLDANVDGAGTETGT